MKILVRVIAVVVVITAVGVGGHFLIRAVIAMHTN